eukprot:7846794-Alexandrium_andersonii.AAC.1
MDAETISDALPRQLAGTGAAYDAAGGEALVYKPDRSTTFKQKLAIEGRGTVMRPLQANGKGRQQAKQVIEKFVSAQANVAGVHWATYAVRRKETYDAKELYETVKDLSDEQFHTAVLDARLKGDDADPRERLLAKQCIE